MNVWTWILIGYFALNLIFLAYKLGRPTKAREAARPGAAALAMVVVGAMYAGLTIVLLHATGVL